LTEFNDYLFDLSLKSDGWFKYLKWMRKHFCCKHGGLDADEHSSGIFPASVNEMSMLAYYKYKNPTKVVFFPVLPAYNYITFNWIGNFSEFGQGGRSVGPSVGKAIFDPGSWGQFLGGTERAPGFKLHFSDGSHIVGLALRMNPYVYEIDIRCSDIEWSNTFSKHILDYVKAAPDYRCVTAPQVRIGVNSSWTPLWNVHVHSKLTDAFLSKPCKCVTVSP
jgi:hypothetical protein